MSKRSPVTLGEPFALPFSTVVSSNFKEESEDAELDALNYSLTRLSQNASLPEARTNRFYDLGSPRDRPGILHTLYFHRRPVGDRFTVEEEFRVSGYLSYSYLRSGSLVAGLVFSSDRSKTLSEEYKLAVRGRETPQNFQPNFNLENMGLLLFVAEDSSTLAIPSHLSSGLLVRAD